MTNYKMSYALNLIEQYIYQHKGIKVNIKPPNNQKEADICQAALVLLHGS